VDTRNKNVFGILKKFIDGEYITTTSCKNDIDNTTKVKVLLGFDEDLYKKKDTGEIKTFNYFSFRNILVDDLKIEDYKAEFEVEIYVASIKNKTKQNEITGRAFIGGWVPMRYGKIVPIKVIAGITTDDEGKEFNFGEEIINNVEKGMTIKVWGNVTVKPIELIITGGEIQQDKEREFDQKLIKKAEIKRKTEIENMNDIPKIKSKDDVAKDILEKLEYLKSMPYKEYLQSDHWKAMRKRQLKLGNYKCNLCNSKDNLNVHHNTYENRGNEKDEDLIVLCQECHAKFHGKFEKEDVIENQITKENIFKTKFFIFNPKNDDNLDNQINIFLFNTYYNEIIDIKMTHSINDTYSALLMYK